MEKSLVIDGCIAAREDVVDHNVAFFGDWTKHSIVDDLFNGNNFFRRDYLFFINGKQHVIDCKVLCHSCLHLFTAHNKMVAAQHNTARIFKDDLQVVDLLDDRIAMGEHDNFRIDYTARLRIAGLNSVSNGELVHLLLLYVSINIFDVNNCIRRETFFFFLEDQVFEQLVFGYSLLRLASCLLLLFYWLLLLLFSYLLLLFLSLYLQ